MAGGRPTAYTDDVIEKAWSYVNGEWQNTSRTVPSVVGLCKHLNRGKSTIYDWAKDPEKQFSDILEALMETQEDLLRDGGLLGDFNPTLAKLFLTKHGYSDKQEVLQDTVISIQGMSDEELERIVTGG